MEDPFLIPGDTLYMNVVAVNDWSWPKTGAIIKFSTGKSDVQYGIAKNYFKMYCLNDGTDMDIGKVQTILGIFTLDENSDVSSEYPCSIPVTQFVYNHKSPLYGETIMKLGTQNQEPFFSQILFGFSDSFLEVSLLLLYNRCLSGELMNKVTIQLLSMSSSICTEGLQTLLTGEFVGVVSQPEVQTQEQTQAQPQAQAQTQTQPQTQTQAPEKATSAPLPVNNESMLSFTVVVDLQLYPGDNIPVSKLTGLACQASKQEMEEAYAELRGTKYIPTALASLSKGVPPPSSDTKQSRERVRQNITAPRNWEERHERMPTN